MAVALFSIGNELRGDDGIAARLCRNLPPELRAKFDYVDLGIHGMDIASYIDGNDAVIVVDAILAPEHLGTLLVFDDLRDTSATPNNTHGLSWLTALRLSSHPPLTFVGVPVASSDWGKGMSSQLEAQIDSLTQQLAAVCKAVLDRTYA
jgi:hydrogenase maturation protease